MPIFKWDGSKWSDIGTVQKSDASGNWGNITGVYYWDGSKWIQTYSNEITVWATIKITDIGSYQGTSSTGGNWTQEPNALTQGAYSTTGWYGGVMLLTKPTIGKGVIRVDNYKLSCTRLQAGNHGNAMNINWRGVNKTSISGDRPTWTTSAPLCDMNMTGGTTTRKSTETGGLEKDSTFKDVLKAWLDGRYANIGIYSGTGKPNQGAYLKINNITLEVQYTYNP